jgi:hypothetical protein
MYNERGMIDDWESNSNTELISMATYNKGTINSVDDNKSIKAKINKALIRDITVMSDDNQNNNLLLEEMN